VTLARRHPRTPGNLKVLHLPWESERMEKQHKIKKAKRAPPNFPW